MSLLNSENTRNVIFYFQVHQPRRLKPVRFFDIGNQDNFFNEDLNRDILERVARTCYLPTNNILLKLIQKYPQIKINFSISGVTLEQFEEYTPEVIDSFRDLAETGSVEFLGETYYHSLASEMPGHEFEIQALKHAETIERLFGKRPTVFRNTELIYSDEVGRRASMLGFNGIFTDGVTQVVKNTKSINQIYHHPTETDFRIFLRNFQLSDDIAFRFSQHNDKLTPEKYLGWLNEIPAYDRMINIAMDYETFGEHQKKESGILDFLRKMLMALAKDNSFRLFTASEAVNEIEPHSVLSVSETVSWADQERDLSAWLGNDMQKDAFKSMLKLEKQVKAISDASLLKKWRQLQTSDHFYYMSTKRGSDGTVHNYFSPYPSPYEAFINYMNTLTDFSTHLNVQPTEKARKKVSKALPQYEEVIA
jgi:alpha-amylase